MKPNSLHLLVPCLVTASLSCCPALRAEEKRVVDLDFKASVTKLPEGAKVVDIWLPIPVDGEGQRVSDVTILANGKGSIGVENVFGNKMYHERFTGPFSKDSALSAELTFQVERTEYVVPAAKSIKESSHEPPPAELAVYLKATPMIPLDGPVAEMSLLLALDKNQPIHSARKAYDYLLDRMNYNWLAKGAGRGDVRWACESKTGDCTDYHSLFIALCRRAGIPADHEFGLPLAKGKKTGKASHFHCWARFWVPEAGWVPIDASEADKHPELREYNFGTLSVNYVRMSHGRAVVLEPPQAGEPLNMFHGPYVEVDGKPHHGIAWSIGFNEVP